MGTPAEETLENTMTFEDCGDYTYVVKNQFRYVMIEKSGTVSIRDSIWSPEELIEIAKKAITVKEQ